MDRLQSKSTTRRTRLARALKMFAVAVSLSAIVQPQISEAGLHHKPKASPNPKKLWEKKPPKHKPQKQHSIFPINTFIKNLLHHGDGNKHGGFHGGGKGHGGHGNCDGC